MDTTMEVEVDEDCTITVTRMPIMSPTTGLLMYSFWNTVPEEQEKAWALSLVTI